MLDILIHQSNQKLNQNKKEFEGNSYMSEGRGGREGLIVGCEK